jgi:hypothetical protein
MGVKRVPPACRDYSVPRCVTVVLRELGCKAFVQLLIRGIETERELQVSALRRAHQLDRAAGAYE